MRIAPTECCFPYCESALTAKVDLPLCDWHLVKTYREVHSLTSNRAYQLKAIEGVIADREKPRPSTVYFIQFADRIKIGHSTNLPQRLTQLPFDRILATIPGTRSKEQQLHHQFRHLRVIGEWFSMGDDLMQYIAKAKAAQAKATA